MEYKEARKVVRGFLQEHYDDEHLAMLLAHAQSGKLAFASCCCLIGIPTANHALRGAWHWDQPHYRAARALDPIYDELNAEFSFDWDPCPLGADSGGLIFEGWVGKRVFCNPPYGPKIGLWLKRALVAKCAVFLIPARTDTKWFHDIVLPKAKEIRFLRGRLKFGKSVNPAPFPSMVVVFDNS